MQRTFGIGWFVPEAAVSNRSSARPLLDHLVGAGEQRWRHIKTECLSRLKVDHQFELGRRLHGQIGRLLASQYAIDVTGRLPVLVNKIRPIRNQTAASCEVTSKVDSGQLVPSRERDNIIAVDHRPRPCRQDQATIWGACERRHSLVDLGDLAHVYWAHVETPQRCRRLDDIPLANSDACCRVPNYGRSCDVRCDLFQQFQPLCAHSVFEEKETSRIASGSRQTINETGADRIRDNRKYDRHRTGCFQQRSYRATPVRKDNVWRKCGQFSRIPASLFGISSPTVVNPHVTANGPPQLLQSLGERREPGLRLGIVPANQD
jgi:hypothetical protein